jgi:predicted tellurium resistance membrane protein TerC
MIMRILLLFSITWIIRLTEPLFTVLSQEISGRDLILIVGGLFLLGKATYEIHDKLEGRRGMAAPGCRRHSAPSSCRSSSSILCSR